VSFAGDVGVDIELHKPSRDFAGIAEYAFGKNEQETVSRFGAESFYAIWTLREAIAKATERGLRQVTDSVDRVAAGPFQEARWSNLDGESWWLMHERPANDLSLAVALRLGTATPRPIAFRRWPHTL
jgi:phosphopantetheinyl transferase